jgi:hypothetical protein
VAKKDLCKLQSLRKVIQQLRQEGLTGVHLLQTFFSRRVQPVRQRAIKMWPYPGPSCSDHALSEELGNVLRYTKP